MPRKQLGAIDAELLAEVDKRAGWLGQTRRVFIERTLQKRLANPDIKVNDCVTGAGEPVYVNLAERELGTLSEPGDSVTLDATYTADQMDDLAARRVSEISPARSTAQVKRDVQPRPKGGKK
jgi:hypothetical protein